MTRNNDKWNGDARDERTSEFAHSEYASTTAGVVHSTWAEQRVLRRRRSRLTGRLLPLLIVVVASGLALVGLVNHLRG